MLKKINRALAKNRPEKTHQCKITDISNKNHSCNPERGGHDFRFLRGDRYGFCVKCGDETLV